MTELKIIWPSPPAQWHLQNTEIHVWGALLQQPTHQIPDQAKSLSIDEYTRAQHFHSERDRNRFIIGRSLLRSILGRYLSLDPRQLKFEYGARGKPSICEHQTTNNLHFNFTHSDDLALLAVTRVCAVGIDLERVRAMGDIDLIAESFFSPTEKDGLKNLPQIQKRLAFFNLWTRKEAFLKATGGGITDSLNQVEVSYLSGDPARLISLFGNAASIDKWVIHDLTPALGYVAALAVPINEFQLKCWRWPE